VAHAAFEHVGHGLEAAVGMIGKARDVSRGIVGAELVEQQERIDLGQGLVPMTRVSLTPAPSLVGWPRARPVTLR